jgi:hypothetical protein
MSEKLKQKIIELSGIYNRYHKVKDSDVAVAKELIQLIESTRSQTTPVPGDRIICIGPERVYERGHLECQPEDYSSVCTEPFISFVFKGQGGLPVFSTSGGYWLSAEASRFALAGICLKRFKTWGHCGPCGNGAFTFQAEVSVWELRSDEIW